MFRKSPHCWVIIMHTDADIRQTLQNAHIQDRGVTSNSAPPPCRTHHMAQWPPPRRCLGAYRPALKFLFPAAKGPLDPPDPRIARSGGCSYDRFRSEKDYLLMMCQRRVMHTTLCPEKDRSLNIFATTAKLRQTK